MGPDRYFFSLLSLVVARKMFFPFPAAIFNHFSHFLFKNYSVCRLLLLHEIKNISDRRAEPQAKAAARAEGLFKEENVKFKSRYSCSR